MPIRSGHLCLICGNESAADPETVRLKELSAGTGREYEYVRCASCGALSIVDPPNDEQERYGADYYSMRSNRRQRLAEDIIFLAYRLFRFDWHRQFSSIAYLPPPDRCASVLDIGCGQGLLVKRLGLQLGYCCVGIDPYVSTDYESPDGRVKVMRKSVEDMTGTYAFVMSNHSIEHVPDPYGFLSHAVRLLEPDGRLLLRLPISPNYLTAKLGHFWFGYGPPDHRHQFTEQSLKMLFRRVGLEVELWNYESSPLIAAISRKLSRGKCFNELRLKDLCPTLGEIREARRSNAQGTGDLVAILLRKSR